jgi:hypothetical protein
MKKTLAIVALAGLAFYVWRRMHANPYAAKAYKSAAGTVYVADLPLPA